MLNFELMEIHQLVTDPRCQLQNLKYKISTPALVQKKHLWHNRMLLSKDWQSGGDTKVPLSGICHLNLYDIYGLGTAVSLFDIKLYSLTLGQCLESLALDRRKMNKDICTVILLDKAKTFGLVEPLNLPFKRHNCNILLFPCFQELLNYDLIFRNTNFIPYCI